MHCCEKYGKKNRRFRSLWRKQGWWHKLYLWRKQGWWHKLYSWGEEQDRHLYTSFHWKNSRHLKHKSVVEDFKCSYERIKHLIFNYSLKQLCRDLFQRLQRDYKHWLADCLDAELESVVLVWTPTVKLICLTPSKMRTGIQCQVNPKLSTLCSRQR